MRMSVAKACICVALSGLGWMGTSQAAESSQEMHMVMKNMCENMDGMPMTMDANVDFVKMMIPHHQSAIDMAQAYLKEGTDPQIIDMAKMIIEAQKKEIEELTAWLKANPKGTPDHAGKASEEMDMVMKSMCENMDGTHMSMDADVDFVKMMIPHHQSALDMAQAYLKEGADPQIIDMAKMIIEAQRKEIEELTVWLENNSEGTPDQQL